HAEMKQQGGAALAKIQDRRAMLSKGQAADAARSPPARDSGGEGSGVGGLYWPSASSKAPHPSPPRHSLRSRGGGDAPSLRRRRIRSPNSAIKRPDFLRETRHAR